MKAFVTAALSLFAILTVAAPQQPLPAHDSSSALAQAEGLYAEHSYSRAHELYQSLDLASLDAAARRWIVFRRADTLWRADAATSNPDSTISEEARKALEALLAASEESATHDDVEAEAQESLGDLFWQARRDFGQAWPHYQAALEFWAGARDLDLARTRYLAIVFRAATGPAGYGSYYSNGIPLQVFENAASIARTADDRGHAHFLLAMQLRNQGDFHSAQRTDEEFKLVVALGKRTSWYDDALNEYAQWLESAGTVFLTDDGQVSRKQDFVRALEIYRRLTSEFSKGETSYYDSAVSRIRNIVDPALGVTVSSVFLPTSETAFTMSYRNVPQVEFTVWRVDLTKDVHFDRGHGDLLQSIVAGASAPFRHWTEKTGDDGHHVPGSKLVRISERLPAGAYLLEGHSGASKARELILVTDATIILKTSGSQALVYVCDAVRGAPLSDSRVVVWESRYENGVNWYSHEATTDGSGLARVTLDSRDSRSIVVTAANGQRQAFASGYSRATPSPTTNWRIYAVTDRPAYRPGETVQWKFTGRTYDGTTYAVPSDRKVQWTVLDPRGAKVLEGSALLNEFGSAWDSFPVTESMALGAYTVQFRQNDNFIGQATIFRLEEYKLPEFSVAVDTPEENGIKKVFRSGDSVEVAIRAEYYFGGPVADATVEAVIYQQPYVHSWPDPFEKYPWYFENDASRGMSSYYYGQQRLSTQTLRTDSEGRATLRFDSPTGGQDMQYRIEARVTDASRREIMGSGNVRVTRSGYYVDLKPEHYIHRPLDPVTVNIRAADANEHPVSVHGKVRVTRERWHEVWIDPAGHEVSGASLQRLREHVFPPPPVDGIAWRLKNRGYEHDEIGEFELTTDAEGSAALKFKADTEGYYRVSWTSPDTPTARFRQHEPITAETTVWVATGSTTDLQYGAGGLELIVDKNSFHAGQRAPVMLVTPASGAYVLFSVERENLFRSELVHIDGTVKLIELDVPEAWIPNVFLSAATISNLDFSLAETEIVVPPAGRFLNVELTTDRKAYEPGDKGIVSVKTTDADGHPVSAELSIGVADASVYAIQDDLSMDPRRFFYGEKRPHFVTTTSSFQQRRYARFVEDKDKNLIDERSKEEGRQASFGDHKKDVTDELDGGVAGGAVSRASKQMAAPMEVSAEARPMSTPSAQSVTVTAAVPESVTVRSDFRSTAFWKPDVVTSKAGTATVEFRYPDSLTTWRATARAVTATTQVGAQTTEARTRKELSVRLQAPRFFVTGDTAVISALIDNNTASPITVTPALEARGLTVVDNSPRTAVTVPANGQGRVDWNVRASTPGTAVLRITGRSAGHSDSMENSYTVYEHGLDKLVVHSGKIRGSEAVIHLDIPDQRRSTRLSVQVTPSMAVTMLDALPYLINYPYGCTEQTMSRFLPTVITMKTLKGLGLSAEAASMHLFGGIDPKSAPATHPGGRHDLEKVDAMTGQGLARLYDFQHGDGGWGWWKDGESDHYMSAYVVWGLAIARDAGVPVDTGHLARGVQYLINESVEEESQPDLQAWMLHALSVARPGAPARFENAAFDNLYGKRDQLNAYTRALLALAANNFGFQDRAQVLVRNLENGAKIDRSPDRSVLIKGGSSSSETVLPTAHWGEDGIWYRWSEGGIESTAFVLRALLAIDPTNALVEPVTNWLVKNRRGSQWSNTRDTAIVVLALNDYLRKSGELSSPVEFSLAVNGREIAHHRLAVSELLSAPSRFEIPADLITGNNEIRIRRLSGSGAIYFSAEARFFSLEEPVTASGNELFVKRLYYKLVARPTLLKGVVYDRVPLLDGGNLRSGERILVVATVETKNNYEYLLFEDLKPAGFEAIELQSGQNLLARELSVKGVRRKFETVHEGDETDYTARSRSVYRELRDRKVAMFVDKLPQGLWEIQYTLRAEVPGTFHALPLTGQAMYVPEIRANGDESRIAVQER
ncbi:MAG: MG2 domain-containing protein [Acidobacteriota bacterium]